MPDNSIFSPDKGPSKSLGRLILGTLLLTKLAILTACSIGSEVAATPDASSVQIRQFPANGSALVLGSDGGAVRITDSPLDQHHMRWEQFNGGRLTLNVYCDGSDTLTASYASFSDPNADPDGELSTKTICEP